ncbi:MAG: S26 family signal peptidase [Synergistaceae bacterium]|nr:S26 family signal peptidase [Synergistaceae bacterium]
MKKKSAKFLAMLLVFSLMAFTFLTLHGLGLRVNISNSMPDLFYRVIPLSSHTPIYPGDYVVLDLSKLSNPVIELGIERGYISRELPMLKEIGAVPGDVALLRPERLYINDDSIPMFVASADSRGGKLPMFPTPIILPPDSYWLISNPKGGFDSRYFGPIHRSAFTHKAYLIFQK